MAYVQFWFSLPHELLWSVTLVNSRALFLQCLCVSGKHSTGLFAETWLVLVLFCHLDFCLGSHKVHLSLRAKDFSCFCICTYMCSHTWIHTDMFIYMCMRSHCCELLVQTSTTKLKFCYAQFISSLHISFHWLKNWCMWQKDQNHFKVFCIVIGNVIQTSEHQSPKHVRGSYLIALFGDNSSSKYF